MCIPYKELNQLKEELLDNENNIISQSPSSVQRKV